MNDKLRAGRFTSSQIYRLLGSPAVRKTYIEEKAIERRFESCLDGDAHSQAIAWGNLMETVLFSKLGTDYVISSDETMLHPVHKKYWAGSSDCLKYVGGNPYAVAEIKCYQKKKFAKYTDCLLKKDVDLLRANFPAEYWQIVSNCAIHGLKYGEAITYMPYESDMAEIKEIAENFDGPDQWKYRFIAELPNSALPVLKNGRYYKDINTFMFDVPDQDFELLENAVIKAASEIKKY